MAQAVPSIEAPDLLTADQVIDRLLSDPALRRVAVICALPAVRHQGEWRFQKSDLDAWIARQRLCIAIKS